MLGGDTTVFDDGDEALVHPLRNLSADNRGPFQIGDGVFNRNWVSAPATPPGRDGLGPGWPELSNQTIHPYTDLLLHDMGPGLADGRPDFEATGSEWRTPPLWGLGLSNVIDGYLFLLHDGRARDFAEAILWHDGQAAPAREAFRDLPKSDRDALVAFLTSL